MFNCRFPLLLEHIRHCLDFLFLLDSSQSDPSRPLPLLLLRQKVLLVISFKQHLVDFPYFVVHSEKLCHMLAVLRVEIKLVILRQSGSVHVLGFL